MEKAMNLLILLLLLLPYHRLLRPSEKEKEKKQLRLFLFASLILFSRPILI